MTTTTPEATRGPARHPLNIGHLVMGLAFIGVVGVWALIQGDVVQGGDVRWLLPVPWVVAGAAGLIATAVTSRGRYGTTTPTSATDPANDTEEIR